MTPGVHSLPDSTVTWMAFSLLLSYLLLGATLFSVIWRSLSHPLGPQRP